VGRSLEFCTRRPANVEFTRISSLRSTFSLLPEETSSHPADPPRSRRLRAADDQNVEFRGDSGGRSTFWLLHDQNVERRNRSAPNSTFWSLPPERDRNRTHSLNARRSKTPG